ncbi:MAG: Ig-like domain repeat protein [Candidatus Dormibacter sp.]
MKTTRRPITALIAALILVSIATAIRPGDALATPATQTTVSIQGTHFLINGQLTSPGKPAEGQLLNTRMAQAIFDDENPATVGAWAYPDTHSWDPQRNTNEFVAMLPAYAQHGIRMITVGLQGGCPAHTPPTLTCPGGDHPWIVSAFNADGSLKPAWMTRLDQVIRAADLNGIVVMVQFFYHGQESKVVDQFTGVNNITDWLVNGGYRNVLVETANECNAGFSTYLDCGNEANVVKQVQTRSGGTLKVSVSFTGGGMPSDDVISQEDLVLLHGNGQTTQQLVDLINGLKAKTSYQANPKPIVVNEDSTSLDNMNASVAAGVSWGYLDTGVNNDVDGFQSPPVNWTINTDLKAAFFDNVLRLAGPNSVATTLTYRGATGGDYHDAATLSATLTEQSGHPIAGKPVAFSLGSQSCIGTTSAAGIAACAVSPSVAAGTYPLTASFAGTALLLPSFASVSFVINPEETGLAYTGATSVPLGGTAHVAGALREDGQAPIAGRAVSFTLGSGAGSQGCVGTTDANGNAACSITGVNQPLGPGSVTAAFAGDGFYQPASANAATMVFDVLPSGAFVVSTEAVAAGHLVTFWSSQWAGLNPLRGGAAPSSFKGFASATTGSDCSASWSSRPGNSATPPSSLPAYMAVIVAGTASKSHSTVTGNTTLIVIVKTDAGYAADPGHSGTGTIVGVVCP